MWGELIETRVTSTPALQPRVYLNQNVTLSKHVVLLLYTSLTAGTQHFTTNLGSAKLWSQIDRLRERPVITDRP